MCLPCPPLCVLSWTFFFFFKLNEQHILAEEGADAASVGFAFLIYFYRHVGQCCLGSSRAGLWACCSRHGAGVAEAPPRIRLCCCCFLLSLALVLLSSPPGSSSCREDSSLLSSTRVQPRHSRECSQSQHWKVETGGFFRLAGQPS